MDLFGTKRRRAIQAGVDAMRPMIGILQHLEGLPPRFWFDDFVLGYSVTLISLMAQVASPNMTTTEKGEVLIEVFSQISNQNGQAIARHATEFTRQPTPDFNLGSDNAMISFGYTFGRLRDEVNNPHVINATEIAEAMGKGGDRSTIGGVLMQQLFHQVIRDRFDMDGERSKNVKTAAAELETACKWIMPAIANMPIPEFEAVAKERGARYSYSEKDRFGFTLSDLATYHVDFREHMRGFVVDCHNEFSGVTLTGSKDHKVSVSLGRKSSPNGRLATYLKDELLKRETFYSLDDLMNKWRS